MAKTLSYSNFNSFNRCKRQFYYDYIAANWNAKNPIRKEAHYLKQLVNKTFWIGKIVEAVIEDVIITQKPPVEEIVDKMKKYIDELITKQYNFSLSNQYRKVVKSRMEDTRQFCRLFEHEYSRDAKGIIESVTTDALQCIHNFLNIKLIDLNRSLYDVLTSTYNQKTQQPVPFSFMGRTFSCFLDYLIPGNIKIIVMDWKVSKSYTSDFSKQILMYLFAIHKTYWGEKRKLEDISGYVINLYNGKVKKYSLNEENIIVIEDYMFDFMRRIDVIIQNRKFDTITSEEFPCTENLNSCNYCNFQKLCYTQEVNFETA